MTFSGLSPKTAVSTRSLSTDVQRNAPCIRWPRAVAYFQTKSCQIVWYSDATCCRSFETKSTGGEGVIVSKFWTRRLVRPKRHETPIPAGTMRKLCCCSWPPNLHIRGPFQKLSLWAAFPFLRRTLLAPLHAQHKQSSQEGQPQHSASVLLPIPQVLMRPFALAHECRQHHLSVKGLVAQARLDP